jgi:hypothetical protein
MPAFPTSTKVLDSVLFRDAFGTSVMRETFSDLSLVSAEREWRGRVQLLRRFRRNYHDPQR